jgi:predicted nucleotidyltransferase
MSPLVESLRRVLEPLPVVRFAVLFGSSAGGRETPRSDVDVGVSFGPAAPGFEADVQVALSRACGRRVDLVRLDGAPPLLRFEIARDGRPLVERTPHAWVDFKARAMTDWWDWAPWARVFHAAAVREVRARLGRGET